MKYLTKLQKVLLAFICGLILLSCILMGLRQNTISNMGYSIWTYIKYGLIDQPFSTFANGVSDFSNLWHVYEDNTYLNRELANQRSYQTLYQNERNRNIELEGLLNMQSAFESSNPINAKVISRPVNAWQQSCTVSAGSMNGVEKNMLVISSQGAVGLISDVQTNTSTVTLFTSDDAVNDLAIQIALEDGSIVEGLLRGYDAQANRYEAVLFDHEVNLSAGVQVSTSGKGGNYPAGVFVGTVTGTQMNDDAIISTVYIRPVTNVSSFDYVEILGSTGVKE